MGKGDLEVYCVIGGSGLNYVVFEDGFLRCGILVCRRVGRGCLANERLKARYQRSVSGMSEEEIE